MENQNKDVPRISAANDNENGSKISMLLKYNCVEFQSMLNAIAAARRPAMIATCRNLLKLVISAKREIKPNPQTKSNAFILFENCGVMGKDFQQVDNSCF